MIDDIRQKIEKLFKLSANNPSEREAQSALAKAYQLLEKHGLEIADVESKQEAAEAVGTLPGNRYSRQPSQDKFICWLLRDFFHVRVLQEPPFRRIKKEGNKVWFRSLFDTDGGRFTRRHLFIGRKTNVLIAQYVFAYLSGEFERQWKEHQASTGKGRIAQLDFYRGLYRGLHERLATEKQRMRDTATAEQRAGLVKLDQDDDVDEFMEREFPRIRHTSSGQRDITDVESFLSGQDAGKNINIRPAVNRGAGQKLLPSTKGGRS